MPVTDLLTKAATWRPVAMVRVDPVHPRAAFEQDSVRRDVAVNVQSAPRPVSDTSFYGIGRDSAHATPTIWQYQQLAFSEWLSVMGWPFGVPKVPSAQVVSMPRGRANAIRDRVNIDMQSQQSLGSLNVLGGAQSFSPSLSKITF